MTNFNTACVNIDLNDMQGWVTVHNKALAGRFARHLLMKNEMISLDDGSGVTVTTLDQYAIDICFTDNWHGPLIKIDVEGYEVQVLRGAESILRLPDTRIEVELHLFGPNGPDCRRYGDAPTDLFSLLTKHKFGVYLPAPRFRHESPEWIRQPNLDSFVMGCLYAFKEETACKMRVL